MRPEYKKRARTVIIVLALVLLINAGIKVLIDAHIL